MTPPRLDYVPDIRLIACDMDGTLLDNNKVIHEDFWPLIKDLHARGIVFCPASGRQYYNLLECFAPVADDLIFIAENGAYVMQAHKEIASDCLPAAITHELIGVVRRAQAEGKDLGIVLCGKQSAYVERSDAAFRQQALQYYNRLQIVSDLTQVEDEFLKLAVYDFVSSERITLPLFEKYQATHQVVVSGLHWLDVMANNVNKGSAISRIQKALNITPEQTMVFGDFLNDLEMFDQAHYSFAMANAHPVLKDKARYMAPSNNDNGVVRTIRSILFPG